MALYTIYSWKEKENTWTFLFLYFSIYLFYSCRINHVTYFLSIPPVVRGAPCNIAVGERDAVMSVRVSSEWARRVVLCVIVALQAMEQQLHVEGSIVSKQTRMEVFHVYTNPCLPSSQHLLETNRFSSEHSPGTTREQNVTYNNNARRDTSAHTGHNNIRYAGSGVRPTRSSHI